VENAINPKKPSDLSDLVDRGLGCSPPPLTKALHAWVPHLFLKPGAYRPSGFVGSTLTDECLAKFLGVHRSAIALWKETEPSFSDAIRQAKVKTDASVAAKLWQRAIGYEVQEEKEFELKDTYYDENGKKLKEEKRTVIVTLTRRVPPDTRAAIRRLRKREPKLWGEK
jgi:hypothetical protein